MTGKPDSQQTSRDWAARGFSCDIWTDPPGQVWADFVHATDELVMLIDGEIELRFSGRVLRPLAGEEVSDSRRCLPHRDQYGAGPTTGSTVISAVEERLRESRCVDSGTMDRNVIPYLRR